MMEGGAQGGQGDSLIDKSPVAGTKSQPCEPFDSQYQLVTTSPPRTCLILDFLALAVLESETYGLVG